MYVYRLAYGEWLIQRMIEETSDGVHMHVIYDIACTLDKHLKVYEVVTCNTS